jgi:uncharacterized repeat protein (TIGR03803 family)
MTRLDGWKQVCAAFLLCFATAITAPAQVAFSTLVDFDGANGAAPATVLMQGFDGNFYGTTQSGGTGPDCYRARCGTVFQMTPTGALTTLYSFCSKNYCFDGEEPVGSLVQTADGDFYGVTEAGGPHTPYCRGCGTIFKINTAGMLTQFYAFCSLPGCSDGSSPVAGLVQASDGNLYGTTSSGGANGGGTVFRITLARQLTTVYSFCALANCADGSYPQSSLVQGSDGNLYGETIFGGASGLGTIFEITSMGEMTTLFSFDGTNGFGPLGGLIQAVNGDFYGVTESGGTAENGTVFRITSAGELTTLYSFCSKTPCADGGAPLGLVQANDGNFYGTTSVGGVGCGEYGCGTVFEITPAGVLTTLFSFDFDDGEYPEAGLLQATNGTFYGTTYGPYDGEIFSLSTGLGPFVASAQDRAKIGKEFDLLGQGLTGTTNVSLNGTPAKFTVESDTLLIARVPSGATTGYVTVTTPSGMLTSNRPFHVVP